jgi:hypothetical protein
MLNLESSTRPRLQTPSFDALTICLEYLCPDGPRPQIAKRRTSTANWELHSLPIRTTEAGFGFRLIGVHDTFIRSSP